MGPCTIRKNTSGVETADKHIVAHGHNVQSKENFYVVIAVMVLLIAASSSPSCPPTCTHLRQKTACPRRTSPSAALVSWWVIERTQEALDREEGDDTER